MSDLPILRAPPFPDGQAQVTSDEADDPESTLPNTPPNRATLFAQIRAAKVGGDFWGDPLPISAPSPLIIRSDNPRDPRISELLATLQPDHRIWISPCGRRIWDESAKAAPPPIHVSHWTKTTPLDPWSLLPLSRAVIGKGDDTWVALARIAERPVYLLSEGRFGSPVDTDHTIDIMIYHRLIQQTYRNPFTGEAASIEQVIEWLALWRQVLGANRSIFAACGMAWWKQAEMRRFLWHPLRPLRLTRRPAKALQRAARSDGAIAIWPSRVAPTILRKAQEQGLPVVRIEDGFIRSAGLGVHLVPPSSIVVDTSGIHYDPHTPSNLETLLETADFPPKLLLRARNLRHSILRAGISKYAVAAPDEAALCKTSNTAQPASAKTRILVPGQVEDDMSVLAGGGPITSNLELLRRVRAAEHDAEIWFRPHPDVEAGLRIGRIATADTLRYADHIDTDTPMATLLERVDAVYTLTSLTGFEALIRSKTVTCYGMPFYAGWGLTQDRATDFTHAAHRRQRRLSLDALVAGTLILYPRYLDPVSKLPCPPEVLIARMSQATMPNRQRWIAPIRQWQGRCLTAIKGR